MAGRGQIHGDSGGQPHGAEGGDDLEEHCLEGRRGHAQQGERRCHYQADAEQRHGQGLSQDVRGEAAPHDCGVGLSAYLREHGGGQYGEGGDLDATGRTRAATADEHQHAGDQERGGVQGPDIEGVEAGCAAHRGVEEAVEDLFAPAEGAQGRLVVPLQQAGQHRAGDQQGHRGHQGELGVQRPVPAPGGALAVTVTQ